MLGWRWEAQCGAWDKGPEKMTSASSTHSRNQGSAGQGGARAKGQQQAYDLA